MREERGVERKEKRRDEELCNREIQKRGKRREKETWIVNFLVTSLPSLLIWLT